MVVLRMAVLSLPRILFAAVLVVWGSLATLVHAQSTRSAIFKMDADGSHIEQVSHKDGWWLGAPALSPDGKKLAYVGTENRRGWGRERIFVETLADGTLVELGYGDAPHWSPNNKEIAFSVGKGTPAVAKVGVYTMNADGSQRQWLCEGSRPRWSPDGSSIATVSSHEGFPSIYIVDSLTLRRKRVLPQGYDSGIIGASWSPDGKKLAFIGFKTGRVLYGAIGDLAIVEAKVDQEPVVLAQGNIGWQPDWSPDGKQLLFWFRFKDQDRLHLLEVGADKRPFELPGQTTARNSDAVWSADGTKILFASDRRP